MWLHRRPQAPRISEEGSVCIPEGRTSHRIAFESLRVPCVATVSPVNPEAACTRWQSLFPRTGNCLSECPTADGGRHHRLLRQPTGSPVASAVVLVQRFSNMAPGKIPGESLKSCGLHSPSYTISERSSKDAKRAQCSHSTALSSPMPCSQVVRGDSILLSCIPLRPFILAAWGHLSFWPGVFQGGQFSARWNAVNMLPPLMAKRSPVYLFLQPLHCIIASICIQLALSEKVSDSTLFLSLLAVIFKSVH